MYIGAPQGVAAEGQVALRSVQIKQLQLVMRSLWFALTIFACSNFKCRQRDEQSQACGRQHSATGGRRRGLPGWARELPVDWHTN